MKMPKSTQHVLQKRHLLKYTRSNRKANITSTQSQISAVIKGRQVAQKDTSVLFLQSQRLRKISLSFLHAFLSSAFLINSAYTTLLSKAHFCNLFLGKSIERWFSVAFLSVFLWRQSESPSPASVSFIIRPSSLVQGCGVSLHRRKFGCPPRTLLPQRTVCRWRGGLQFREDV